MRMRKIDKELVRIRLRWEWNAERLAAKLLETLAPTGILPVINRSQVILDCQV